MEKFYKGHALCIKEECKMADICLRIKGFKTATNEDEHLTIVNPNVATGDKGCPYLSAMIRVRSACGFKKVFDELPSGKAKEIFHQLYASFGKNQYYDRKNGKLPLDDFEQEAIRKVFRSYGYEGEVFDRYEEVDEWG